MAHDRVRDMLELDLLVGPEARHRPEPRPRPPTEGRVTGQIKLEIATGEIAFLPPEETEKTPK